jgi:hypothetical protein
MVAAAVVTALAFCWRVELLPAAEGEPVPQKSGQEFGTILEPGFNGISDAYLVPADMGFNDFHLKDQMWIGEHRLQNRFDFSVFPPRS